MLNANRAGIGTYHRALHFGRVLQRAGHDVKLMTVSPDQKFTSRTRTDESGMTIVECPNFLDELLPWHASGVIDVWLRIREILFGGYDVVYAFEYQPNVSIPVYTTRWLKRYVLMSDWCDWHAGASYHFGGKKWAHAIDRVFEERIRHVADHLTTINKMLADRATSIGLPPEKVTIVPEGVDPDYIVPMDKAANRLVLGIPAGGPIVGTIRDSVKSFRLLAESIRDCGRDDVRLLYVGRPSQEVLDAAATFGLAERLITPGRVSDEDLPRYLACADVLALPLEDDLHNWGRWPHKLGDMIAACRPVIVSNVGEFPQLLAEREAAVVVPFTVPAFSAAIGQVLDAPQAFTLQAEAGRRLIEQELNWTVIGAKLLRITEALRR